MKARLNLKLSPRTQRLGHSKLFAPIPLRPHKNSYVALFYLSISTLNILLQMLKSLYEK